MTCDDVRKAVKSGVPLDGALGEHARSCEACASLLDAGGTIAHLLAHADDNDDGDALVPMMSRLDALVDAETGGAGMLRSLATTTRFAIAFSTSAAIAIGVFSVRPRLDLSAYPAERMALTLGAFALSLVATLRYVVRPLQAPAPNETRRRVAMATVVLSCVVLAALPATHEIGADPLAGARDDLIPRALSCFSFGLATGAPLFFLLRLLDRQTHRAFWPLLASLASVGLLGNIVLQLHCPLTHPAHLLLGHASITVLAVLAGVASWRSLGARSP